MSAFDLTDVSAADCEMVKSSVRNVIKQCMDERNSYIIMTSLCIDFHSGIVFSSKDYNYRSPLVTIDAIPEREAANEDESTSSDSEEELSQRESKLVGGSGSNGGGAGRQMAGADDGFISTSSSNSAMGFGGLPVFRAGLDYPFLKASHRELPTSYPDLAVYEFALEHSKLRSKSVDVRHVEQQEREVLYARADAIVDWINKGQKALEKNDQSITIEYIEEGDRSRGASRSSSTATAVLANPIVVDGDTFYDDVTQEGSSPTVTRSPEKPPWKDLSNEKSSSSEETFYDEANRKVKVPKKTSAENTKSSSKETFYDETTKQTIVMSKEKTSSAEDTEGLKKLSGEKPSSAEDTFHDDFLKQLKGEAGSREEVPKKQSSAEQSAPPKEAPKKASAEEAFYDEANQKVKVPKKSSAEDTKSSSKETFYDETTKQAIVMSKEKVPSAEDDFHDDPTQKSSQVSVPSTNLIPIESTQESAKDPPKKLSNEKSSSEETFYDEANRKVKVPKKSSAENTKSSSKETFYDETTKQSVVVPKEKTPSAEEDFHDDPTQKSSQVSVPSTNLIPIESTQESTKSPPKKLSKETFYDETTQQSVVVPKEKTPSAEEEFHDDPTQKSSQVSVPSTNLIPIESHQESESSIVQQKIIEEAPPAPDVIYDEHPQKSFSPSATSLDTGKQLPVDTTQDDIKSPVLDGALPTHETAPAPPLPSGKTTADVEVGTSCALDQEGFFAQGPVGGVWEKVAANGKVTKSIQCGGNFTV